MTDHSPPPLEGLTRWLGDGAGPDASMPDEDDDRSTRHRRRLVRASALALPWVLMAVFIVLRPGAGTDQSAGADPGAPVDVPVASASDAPAGTDAGARPGTTGPQAPPSVAATAVGLVRDALTGRDGGTVTAVDTVAPEAPQALDPTRWLVRVHVVVLRGDDRRWRSATHEVWAVPVGVHDGRVSGLDHPWRVASGGPEMDTAGWRRAAVDEGAIRTALRAAGIRPPGRLRAQRHPDLPDIVRVRLAAGGHVWLRTAPDVAVVGGTEDATP